MNFKALFIIFILLIAAFSVGCTEEATPTDSLKIGVVASMTGPASTTGKDIWQSAVLAADEINENGGVYISKLDKKVPVTLILGDDESTREGGQKAVSKLITNDNVDVLVGGFSSAVVSAHQSIVAEYKVPYIITGASSPIITRRTDIDTSDMFHHAPTCDASARQTTLFINDTIRPAVNAKFDFASDRPLRLAILYQDSPYGKGVESAIENTIATENLNILVVDKESFRMGEADFRTVLTAIKATKPDAVYAATFLNEQIPLVLQARRDVGLDTIFLAVECNDDPDYYEGVGKSGEYSIIQSRFGPYAIPQGDIASGIINFKNNFESKWSGFPGMMGASTYEGIFIAAQAVENAGTLDKGEIRNAIAETEMPQIVETMQNQTIMFTSDYRESQFELYMEQLIWDNDINELRAKIVWPDNLKEADFVLPGWYVPGSA